MHKLLFASVAALAIATPATARSNSGYVGLEGGVLIPRNTHVDASVDFTDPLVPDIIDRRIATVKYKTGYDVDLIGGYDFGMTAARPTHRASSCSPPASSPIAAAGSTSNSTPRTSSLCASTGAASCRPPPS